MIALILLLANYEANKFINKKTFEIEPGRFTHFSLSPKNMDIRYKDVQIGSMLFAAYWNLVFNLIYIKILKGNFFWLKILSPKKIIKSIFFFLIGINRLAIKISYNLYKHRKFEIEDIIYFKLLSIFHNEKKIIVKLNNKWILNGNGRNLLNTLQKIASDKWNEKLVEKCNNILYEQNKKLDDIGSYKKTYWANHLNLETKQKHLIWLDINKQEDKVGYQTDFNKAIIKNNYDKTLLINKYWGGKKDSTLLPEDLNNLKQIGNETPSSNKRLIEGGYKNGFDKNQLKPEIIENIEDFEKIIIETKKLLEEIGIDEDQSNLIVKSICDDFLEK